MKSKDVRIALIKEVYPEISNRIAALFLSTNSISIDANNQIRILDLSSIRNILLKNSFYANKPVSSKIKVIFEDANTLIVFKPYGITVEPEGKKAGLVNHVTFYINTKSNSPISIPRPVHRLDKDTTGLIIFSKNILSHRYYSKLFKEHDLKKTYKAIVKGDFNRYLKVKKTTLPLIIESNINEKPYNRKYYSTNDNSGKIAQTIIKKSKYSKEDNTTELEIEITTGRTHQIRVHLSEIGFPIIGDKIYGDIAENVLPLQLIATQLKIIVYGNNFDSQFVL